MGKCLDTRLKAVVDNELLPKLDEIVLQTSRVVDNKYNWKSAILQLAYFSGQEYTIEIIGNGVFAESFEDLSDPSKTMTIGTFTGTNSLVPYYFSNGDYAVKISNKENITMFRLQTFGGVIDDTLFNINLYDLDYLIYVSYLTLARANIYGNLEGHLKYLQNLSDFDTKNSQITGTIESLAAAQVAGGRTSGTLAVYGNGIITCNGAVVPNGTAKTITFDSTTPNGYTIA